MKSRKWVVKPKAPTVEDVLAVYLEEYEKRYRTKISSGVQKQQIKRDLECVVGRVGVEKAIDAVKLAFGQRMKWMMNRNKAGFLATKQNWENHIVDLLEQPEVTVGESGQWDGDKTDEPGRQKFW